MATIRAVRDAAAKTGATVNYERATGTLDAWAPRGYVFKCNGCHCSAHHFEPGPWHAEMLDELASALAEGLEPCTETDCEICG